MEETPRRSNAGLALLAALLIAGSAAGVMFWQLSQKEKPVAAGFGLDSVAPPGDVSSAAAPAAPRSGLDMIAGSIPAQPPTSLAQAPAAVASPQKPVAGPSGSAAPAFTAAVRKSEARARALAVEYTARYPVILQYGQDWMSRPALKKLNDDYMADHDPVKFLRGLAGSPDFRELAAKYAGDPAVRAFAKDALKEAPQELVAAAAGMLVEDGLLRALVSDAGKALDLPQEFTDGLKDYGKQPAPPAR